MTIPREEIVDPEQSGIYHCWSRCVRRGFLCGTDTLTGKNYDHRKQWVVNRLKYLSNIFLIDVFAYAIMSNHNHLVLRTNPHKAKDLTEREVAYRWLMLFHKSYQWNDSKNEPKEEAIDDLIENSESIEKFRKRLCNLSWFMRCLKQNISVRANIEDDVRGHFWEQRFKCQRIEDDVGLITCMIYVDLNEIRAQMANCPEESLFTSAYQRIVARQAKKKIELSTFMGKTISSDLKNNSKADNWLASLNAKTDQDAILSISSDEYLTLLDITGKHIITGKRGSIPKSLSPILTRLKINPETWIDATTSLSTHFSHIIGSKSSLKTVAKQLGRSWLKGIKTAEVFFYS